MKEIAEGAFYDTVTWTEGQVTYMLYVSTYGDDLRSSGLLYGQPLIAESLIPDGRTITLRGQPTEWRPKTYPPVVVTGYDELGAITFRNMDDLKCPLFAAWVPVAHHYEVMLAVEMNDLSRDAITEAATRAFIQAHTRPFAVYGRADFDAYAERWMTEWIGTRYPASVNPKDIADYAVDVLALDKRVKARRREMTTPMARFITWLKGHAE